MEIGILIFVGVIGGMIAGLLGLGGGIFYILLLPYIIASIGIPTDQVTPFVVANSLIGIAFASVISLLVQFTDIKKYLSEIAIIGIPAVAISLIITKYVVHSSWFSIEFFNVLVILLMIYLLFEISSKNKKSNNTTNTLPNKKIKLNIGLFSGFTAGLVSALSGLGGGIVIIPILNIYLKQNLRKSKIISLGVIFMSSALISIQNLLSQPHFQPDNIDTIGFIIPRITIPLIIGVVIGGPLGVKLGGKISDKTINLMFMFFVILVLLEKIIGLL